MTERKGITKTCYRIAESKLFQYFVLAVILAAAALVGVETYLEITQKHHSLLDSVVRRASETVDFVELSCFDRLGGPSYDIRD